ncbi:MAG TPA: PEP/pyruvate-binding domain-containing protein [Victivallales bacterium]|nr:PEP/pyruvate-binding domain-containing protein [Victivallales bacterium]
MSGIFHSSADFIPDISSVGGKGRSLFTLKLKGFPVPDFFVVQSEFFKEFIKSNNLMESVEFELARKEISQMRWEEMWDASLRIRNLLMKTEISESMRTEILDAARSLSDVKSFAVRSSSISEDGAELSFAGIHDSFVDVCGDEELIKNIKLVWASLWSPSAFVYAKEMGYRIHQESMAVVVQKFVKGDFSGVMFSENPSDKTQFIIEAVPGLNQDFVDGKIEPYRWVFRKSDGKLSNFSEASGLGKDISDSLQILIPSLKENLFAIEEVFGTPQDVEWTAKGGKLQILQARPITARKSHGLSERSAFDIRLRRSFSSLKQLRKRIYEEILPGIQRDIDKMLRKDLSLMDDSELLSETEERVCIFEKCNRIYWEVFIPFGHGMRLFGETYNDLVKPEDPYEFMGVLQEKKSIASIRNLYLIEMSNYVLKNPLLLSELKGNMIVNDPKLKKMIESFVAKFASSMEGGGDLRSIIKILLKYVDSKIKISSVGTIRPEKLKRKFLKYFSPDDKKTAEELIELAKESYSMRDDDNLLLLKIKSFIESVVSEIRKRERNSGKTFPGALLEKLEKILDSGISPKNKEANKNVAQEVFFRQLRGQPAGAGIATGKAKIIRNRHDIMDFKSGSVMVCDSIEPEMNFLIPLAAGIVERRGGMLIHGAIAAREYGIPCVTGISDATALIKDGDYVTVDGYIGTVRIDSF